MNNYQSRRYRAFERRRWKLRFAVTQRRIAQKWGHRFKVARLEVARQWEARQLRRGHPDMTLLQSRMLQFLSELRRSH